MTIMDRLKEFVDTLPEECVFALEAQRFITKDSRKYPGELDEWFHVHKTRLIAAAMTDIIGEQRRVAAKRVRAGVFPEDPAEHEAHARRLIDEWHAVDPEHLRKRAGDMTGADHRFVADSYQASGNYALLRAAFHNAVAKKVGTRKTSDVIDADTYETMYQSITSTKPRTTAT